MLCLQEVKASLEQVPAALCELPGYHCYWHGHKGYSGVALHLSRAAFPARPEFAHPEFDHETRIVTARAGDLLFASIYVPNGGKDFPAKVRFLDALDAFARDARAAGLRLVLCGDLNVAREERDVHPSVAQARADRAAPDERAQLERVIAPRPVRPVAQVPARRRSAVHVVGAVAQPAPEERRLAPRLRAVQRRARRARHALQRRARVRHQRSRARHRRIRRAKRRVLRASSASEPAPRAGQLPLVLSACAMRKARQYCNAEARRTNAHIAHVAIDLSATLRIVAR